MFPRRQQAVPRSRLRAVAKAARMRRCQERSRANKPHAKPCTVALDHAVKRRITVYKVDCKPEFGSEEIARRLDVNDIELSFRPTEDRSCHCLFDLSAHG